jgi:cell wall-associated NlpC family hydrolase
MPAPIVVAAGQVARKVILRRLLRIGVAILPFAVVGGTAIAVLTLLMVMSGSGDSETSTSAGSCSTVSPGGTGQMAGLRADQLVNAQTIVAVGRQLHVPPYGWVVAIATALQESSLTNLQHGDLDSLGLFQQRASWGPDTARLDPESAARMFYAGGQHGQKGLLQIPGFQSMPLTEAAQSVQHSAFPDAYTRWESVAQAIVANPTVLSATCYTAAEFRGDGTSGSNAVAAALQYLGTPYSWGGGGIGGPTIGFGPGGATVGFDCSSLVQYAMHKATGLTLPRTTDAQAAALPLVPLGSPLRAGDLLFFHSPDDPPGTYHHVGIYDGQGGMVHAPRTGKTVEVVHNVLNDPYFSSQLALVARPTGGPDNVRAVGKLG